MQKLQQQENSLTEEQSKLQGIYSDLNIASD